MKESERGVRRNKMGKGKGRERKAEEEKAKTKNKEKENRLWKKETFLQETQ